MPQTQVNKVITIAYILALILSAGTFFNTVFRSLTPFLWEKNEAISSIKLNEDLDEVVAYIRQKEDLTSPAFLATLDKEESSKLAEVINGSGVPFDTEAMIMSFKAAGITVSQIGNSQDVAENTVIAFKENSLSYKQTVVDKIGTRSGEIRFERLDDSHPFDIRIIIGK